MVFIKDRIFGDLLRKDHPVVNEMHCILISDSLSSIAHTILTQRTIGVPL